MDTAAFGGRRLCRRLTLAEGLARLRLRHFLRPPSTNYRIEPLRPEEVLHDRH